MKKILVLTIFICSTGFSQTYIQQINGKANIRIPQAWISGDSLVVPGITPTRNTGAIVFAVLSNGATAMAFGTNSCVSVTPTATATFTTTVPAAGCDSYLIIVTTGTTSRTITFGTGFKSTGTLATGTTSGKTFVLHFMSDGTNCIEAGRTTAQ